MTVVETILVYVGAPLAVVLLLALLTLVPGARRRKVRYKPGQPWEHEPVWYEPHPQGGGHGPTEAHGPAAVPGDGTTALGSSMYPEQHDGPAHDGGHGHGRGATALPSAAAVAAARPYGGARGTW
ncbi:aa3-type cytochrome oxidase subunit CtaJ [Geodermatophilus sp. SYSU D01105]